MKDYMTIHKKAFVIDAHSDIPLDLLRNRSQISDSLFDRDGKGNLLTNRHLPELKRGKVDLVFVNLFPELIPEGCLKEAMLEVAILLQQMEETGEIIPITSKKDLETLKGSGKIGFLLSMEGMEPLGQDLELLSVFYRLGLRSAMLTWNYRNSFASGVNESGGLSRLGRRAVTVMEQLGIIVDVSHLNDEGFWDVIDVAQRPVIASHSNARALYNHPRNLTDDQIRAIADTGGVIGINGYFTADLDRASLKTCIEHLEYILDLAGEDHVGLGPDFNLYLGGAYQGTPGLEDAGKIPEITRELVARGYSETVINKILGNNFYRVLTNILK